MFAKRRTLDYLLTAQRQASFEAVVRLTLELELSRARYGQLLQPSLERCTMSTVSWIQS